MTEYCEHVYKDMHVEVCPSCGALLYETDWNLIHQQHKEWIASGKAVAQGWWSI